MVTEDRGAFRRHLNLVLKGRERQTIELRLKRKDAQAFFTLLESAFYQDTAGRSLCRTAFTDISKRRQAEESSRISNKRTIDVLESISDGFFSCDQEMVVTCFNSTAAKILDRDRNEVLGRKLFDAFPEAKGSVFEEKYTEALRKGKFISFEAYFEPEPYRNWYDVRVFPHEGGISVYFQVTERKRAEEELRQTLQEAEQHRKEAEALLHAARAVMIQHTFAEAAWEIFERCRETIGAPAGYVSLLSGTGDYNEVVFLESGGLPCTVDPDLPMPIRGLRAEAYRTGEVVYDNDFAHSKYVKFLPDGHAALENVLFAPLVHEAKVVGLLGLSNKPGGFTPHDARLVAGFAYLAAVALVSRRAEEALRRLNEELEQRVEKRASELSQTVEQLLWEVGERQQTEQALRESEEKLLTLTSQLLTGQEEERIRLSRELHDSLGQTLLVLKLQMRAIETRLRPDQQTLRQESEQTLRQIDRIIEDVRRLARNLSPSVLENIGLAAALRSLCEEFSRHQNLSLSLDMDDISGIFSPEAQSHIYRIFQESLTNISKYAEAIRVSLAIKRRDGGVAFVIKDDGIGFQMEEVQARGGVVRAMGLTTMAERVRILGGKLDITSKRGGGTIISFIVPEASVS
jgi:PAS domain S-box-containing protein